MRALLLIALAAPAWAQTVAGERVIGSEADISALAFLADGATLAGAGRDGNVRLWDARSGALKRTIPLDKGDAAVTLVAAHDQLAAVGSDGSIKIWNLPSGERAQKLAGFLPEAEGLAFFQDRKLVAASSRVAPRSSAYTMLVWEGSGTQRFAVPAGLGGTAALAFSPGGGVLVASSYDTDIRAWNARNGELLRLIDELTVATFALAFSPDGGYLASAGVDRVVYLWDTKSWKLARKLAGQPEMISAIAFSPDGRLLLTGGFSELTRSHPVSILLWDVAAGKVLGAFPAPHRVYSLAFSPDGKLAAYSAGQKAVNVWPTAGLPRP